MKVRRNLLIALSLLSLSANAQRIKGSDTVLPVAQQTAERFSIRMRGSLSPEEAPGSASPH